MRIVHGCFSKIPSNTGLRWTPLHWRNGEAKMTPLDIASLSRVEAVCPGGMIWSSPMFIECLLQVFNLFFLTRQKKFTIGKKGAQSVSVYCTVLHPCIAAQYPSGRQLPVVSPYNGSCGVKLGRVKSQYEEGRKKLNEICKEIRVTKEWKLEYYIYELAHTFCYDFDLFYPTTDTWTYSI